MPKERDEYAIQGRIMTEKYGALPCQHLYKWLTFVIPKGFREFASILDSVLEDLESRDAFIRFMEDPIETTKETLLRCVGFADTPLGSWIPVSKHGSPSWEVLRWVYSNPAHYFEVIRVLFKVRADVPPRYAKVTPALLEFFAKQVPANLPVSADLPVPAPRAKYGSKSKKEDEEMSDSESAVADPDREERIFSKTSTRVLEKIQAAGLTLESPDEDISSTMLQDCPLAYKCTPGRDCADCSRLYSVLTELRRRKAEEKSPKDTKEVTQPGALSESLREAARNAAKAAVLDGLCRSNREIKELVDKVLQGLF